MYQFGEQGSRYIYALVIKFLQQYTTNIFDVYW